MITSAQYTASGSIRATIDGVEMSVPDDMANRDRRMIAEWEAEGNVIEPFVPDMEALRQQAFQRAMAYGNAITGQITNTYADAEARSWTVQELEAREVLAGGQLPASAMLPALATDKGQTVEIYAQSVIAKADQFRQIAVAAVRLRRGAEQLLSPTLDTPETLQAAVDALRAQADAAATQLGVG